MYEGGGRGNALAIIRPIPLVPPVTSATRPFTENRLLILVDAMVDLAKDGDTSQKGGELLRLPRANLGGVLQQKICMGTSCC